MTRAGSRRTFLDRIGGPNAVSWPVLVIALAFTGIAYVLGLPGVPWSDPPARIAALAVAQLGLLAVLLGARRTYLRETAARPRPWLTLATFAVASAMAGRPVALALEALDVVPQGDLSARFPGGWPATFVVLVLAALAVDALAEHRRRRNLLEEQRDRLAHTRATVAAEIAARQQGTVDGISLELTRAIDDLAVGSPREAVETLRWAAQVIVRPLSHELATQTAAFTPAPAPVRRLGLEWGRLLGDATTGRQIPPIALALTLSLLSFVFTVNRLGMASGLVSLAVVTVTVWLGANAANRVLAAVQPHLSAGGRAVALTAALGILSLLSTGVSHLVSPIGARPASALLGIAVTVFIGWTLALTRAVQHQLARTEAELQTLTRELEWEIARANQTQWQQQRALARALHGPVQAAVNAAALRLDAAVRDGSVSDELIESERRAIIEALGILPTAIADSTPDIALAFQRVQGTWAGVCDIRIVVSDALLASIAADPTCSSAVADIVTESCANAVRHGHATHVSATITQPDSARLLLVTIENDGERLDPHSPAGLGTSLIDAVALDWHLDAQPHGSRLTATLPTATGPRRGSAVAGGCAASPGRG